jgi:circadian clock protein KaiC
VLGEPPFEMLRYQQQFAFFDIARVNDSVRFIYLGAEARDGGLSGVLRRIDQEVEVALPSTSSWTLSNRSSGSGEGGRSD